ncbi:hypothetical protein HNP84_002299 [Thermocatellispora tengchongensis]|uniref:Uncharacterized protein n=1 Tax=Thermocatellispora tengchongensis TaxID=1073253 RepID=A0A840P3V6_9ACTN|nr:hypothetical protein [Thermocatellispora tengchongensis]MBB5132583.1 hypothetical protein [Thermocatellispora tengchongensis]
MGKHSDPDSPKDQELKPDKPNNDQEVRPGGAHAGDGRKDGAE